MNESLRSVNGTSATARIISDGSGATIGVRWRVSVQLTLQRLSILSSFVRSARAWPITHADSIEDEIPQESRVVVLTLYRLWMLLVVTLIANLVACILLCARSSLQR